MPTQSDAAQIRYCILYYLGYWGTLEVECRITPCPEFDVLIDHNVTFVLINKFVDRSHIGYSIITGQTDRVTVFDEDGVTFSDLDTAVRTHAARLMEVMEMPGRWRDRPARYDTWQVRWQRRSTLSPRRKSRAKLD
jgi:hypothetical protein